MGMLSHKLGLHLSELFRPDDAEITAGKTQIILCKAHIIGRTGDVPGILEIAGQLNHLSDFFLKTQIRQQTAQFRFVHSLSSSGLKPLCG